MAAVPVGARRAALGLDARREPVSSRVRVSGMQRARLLSAAAVTIEEQGWSGASVAHITARARVSRRTFYDLFANREECVLAVLDDAVARVTGELATIGLGGLSWRERMRAGLWTILCFCDREPALAGCVLQSAAGDRRVLERRAEIMARLAVAVDTGRGESARAAGAPVLTAEGVVGAAVSILYTRLLRGEREPLAGLVNELMSIVVLPYLGVAAARQEAIRTVPSVAGVGKPRSSKREGGVAREDPLRDVPMRLTYRTARVLEALAGISGASNRMVADGAGIYDQGQVSKLLARLERLGLIENTSGNDHKPTGEPNAWRLTPRGRQIGHALHIQPDDDAPKDSARNRSPE
jgi:AcrR family transcriptional regulator